MTSLFACGRAVFKIYDGMTSLLRLGGFQNPGVCLQAFPSFLHLHSSPCNSLLPNCTETLATQASVSAQETSCQNFFSSPLYVRDIFLGRWACAGFFFLRICTCRIFFFSKSPPPPQKKVKWLGPLSFKIGD